MATKTRRQEEKIVRYRTPADRFRTKNSQESSKYLVFASCPHEHLFIRWGSLVKNIGQVQRMAQILHLKKMYKILRNGNFFAGRFVFIISVFKVYEANKK